MKFNYLIAPEDQDLQKESPERIIGFCVEYSPDLKIKVERNYIKEHFKDVRYPNEKIIKVLDSFYEGKNALVCAPKNSIDCFLDLSVWLNRLMLIDKEDNGFYDQVEIAPINGMSMYNFWDCQEQADEETSYRRYPLVYHCYMLDLCNVDKEHIRDCFYFLQKLSFSKNKRVVVLVEKNFLGKLPGFELIEY